MGIFGDFFRFFTSAFLGNKDAMKAFRESLHMAENYIRWGNERKDRRDFDSAMTQLDMCRDEDAPKADMLVRKYQAMCNAITGEINLMAEKHKENHNDINTGHDGLIKEKSTVEGQISTAKLRVEQLKQEGSLIKAKEEERHIEELNVKYAHLINILESGQALNGIFESYEKFANESEKLCQKLESSIVTLELNPGLPPEAVHSLKDQIQGRIESLRSMIAGLKPENKPEDSESTESGEEDEAQEQADLES